MYRPVKYSAPLKATLLSILGFMIGGTAGLLQASYALNRYIHNTQWVIGPHAHILLLVGLSFTLFAAIYALAPILTGKDLDGRLADIHLLLFFIGAIVMALSMGFAGVNGMLRRTLYFNGEYYEFMNATLIGGLLMAVGYLVFLINFIKNYGIKVVLIILK